MSNKALVIRANTPPLTVVNFFESGQASEADLVTALTQQLPTERAKEVMAQFPVPVQARLVNQDLGSGTEAPVLALVPTEQASATVLLNTVLFHTRTREELYRLHSVEWEDVADRLEEHLIQVTKSDGTRVELPLFFDPDQAYVLANTILRHQDPHWREAAIEELGDDFFAAVASAYRQGLIRPDEEDWLDFWQRLPDQMREYCAHLSQELSFATISGDLIQRHAQTTANQFAISEIPEEREAIDRIVDELAAKRSADELAAELEGTDDDWDDDEQPNLDFDIEGDL